MLYQELTAYSPNLDCNVTRLSTCGDHGGPEHFCLVPRTPRFKPGEKRPIPWREVRKSALEQLSEAIEAGAEPGEITIELDA